MSKKKSDISSFFLDLPLGVEFLVKIKSGSMSPLFLVGDSVLVKKIDFSEIKRGDIVCFYQKSKGDLIIHRVSSIKYLENGQNSKLFTQGDAVNIIDPSTTQIANYVGLVIAKANNETKPNIFEINLFIWLQRLFLKHKSIRDFFY